MPAYIVWRWRRVVRVVFFMSRNHFKPKLFQFRILIFKLKFTVMRLCVWCGGFCVSSTLHRHIHIFVAILVLLLVLRDVKRAKRFSDFSSARSPVPYRLQVCLYCISNPYACTFYSLSPQYMQFDCRLSTNGILMRNYYLCAVEE